LQELNLGGREDIPQHKPLGIHPIDFMWLLNIIVSKYLDKFILVFIHDILIYSNTKEEHEEHLRSVLQVSREHQLYAKYNKSDFFQKKIQYWDHTILEDGVSVYLENIKAIMDWPTPRNVSNVRSFMGLARYYRRFIKGFSKIGHPIILLQRK
jgi:hypothetical protein